MRPILILSFLLTPMMLIYAQPIASPLSSNPVLQEYAEKYPDRAKTQFKSAPVVLTIPFMDDFSYASLESSELHYPITSLWLDNDVFINNTLSVNPPSIGVATFDGLDANGEPYLSYIGVNEDDWADTLTSQIINLGGLSESDNVILSFFAQPQGLGNAPEAIDKLILEFKDTAGVWKIMEEIEGSELVDFQYYDHKVNASFLSPEFQFRFRNFSARTGFIDLWHIDYVKMDKNRVENDSIFNDVCFTNLPKPILDEFTAMPWKHYQDDILGETNFLIAMDIRNHSNMQYSLNNPIYRVDEVFTNTNLIDRNNGSTNAPASSDIDIDDNLAASDFAFNSLSNNLTQAIVKTQHSYTASGQESINQAGYDPVLQNDRVSTETVFANYFAYDDGTAEYNVQLKTEGSLAAVRFRPNVDDVLEEVRIHIPYAADIVDEGQEFTLKVWEKHPDRNEPADEAIYSKLHVPQYGNGIGRFYSYAIYPPLPLTEDTDYFIGWEQGFVPGENGIPVGMDVNNTAAAPNNFFNLDNGEGWKSFPPNLQGALMIRAVVGGQEYVATETLTDANEIATIFPNPVDENIFINIKTGEYQNYTIEIYNTVGQNIYQDALTPSVSMTDFSSGIYFIQIKENNTDKVYYHKFIKN